MGFMDKAKKLAEQAQEKLDEAQKQFNSGGSTAGQAQGGGVQYDQHGRPVEAPPASEAPPPRPSRRIPPRRRPIRGTSPRPHPVTRTRTRIRSSRFSERSLRA